jgi:DNA topoisomerase-1
MTALEQLRATGIRRLGRHPAFRYRTAAGRAVDARSLTRIDALRIPPAWRDVRIAAGPRAMLQAVGRDRAGRWQYLYHRAQTHRRERAKAQRLLQFLRALPRLRQQVTRDLRKPGLPRERVLACTVRIMSTCFLRPGSEVYAEQNGSFGIATLRRRHVEVRGAKIAFDFEGKSRKRQAHELEDRSCARVIKSLLALPGPEVFKWQDEGGEVVDVRRRHIAEYVREASGGPFTAKDFRTWAGTLVCACALAHEPPSEPSARARRRHLAEALRVTAGLLGNTPAVCRASYVSSRVLERFEAGEVLQGPGPRALLAGDRRALRRVERELIRMLKKRA